MLEEEMKKVEAFFGKPFKEKPRVLPWTKQNVRKAMEEQNEWLGLKTTQTEVDVKYGSGNPFACIETNTAVVAEDAKKTQQLHELTHLYVHQHWPRINDRRIATLKEKKFTEEDCERFYANVALNEGIAEYVSLSLHENTERRLSLSSFFTRQVRDEFFWRDIRRVHKASESWRGMHHYPRFAYGLGYLYVTEHLLDKHAYEGVAELTEKKPSIVEMAALIEEASK